MARASANGLGRGRSHGAAPPGALGERLLHAQGPAGRLLPRRLHATGPVRRAPARPHRRRPRPRVRAARALRGARRVPAARSLARALRPGRPPRRARAAEAQAGRRRAVRGRAQAPASVPAPPHRPRDRERRCRQARRPDRDHDALSTGLGFWSRRPTFRGREPPARDRGSRSSLPRRRGRGRRGPRRRQLRGPAAFQRRAARPGDRRAARCRS